MDIRKIFLDYFKKNDHMVMPSSSLIPSDDPSVLLTTAGMQQFKPYYLGIKKPPYKRITTVQKCFRTSDIDSVGYTDRHLTFFEMLGNFAFADYFKKEAIKFTIEFLTLILKISVDKLSVGVFSGDDSIPEDIESMELWQSHGIPEARIYRFGRSENFWGPAGDTGPCGPCTEIYYDFGAEHGCGNKECSPVCDCGRFLEIWNLVFTQYNYNGKNYEELPNKNIDTGMGLERIEAVLRNDPSVFRTKHFSLIISKIEELSGKKLLSIRDEGYNNETNRCIKIAADHSRAICFLISDGVIPSNESRGYILRRIIRRAVRFGKLIDINDFFLEEIAKTVIEAYGRHYPELIENREKILDLINKEERKFSRTLKDGTKMLAQKIEELLSSGRKYIDPESAFKLYDTFGFPVELTMEILKENNLELDNDSFNNFVKIHSEKSKSKTVFDKKIEENLDIYKNIAACGEIEFTGYRESDSSSEILALLKEDENGKFSETDSLHEGMYGEIILDKTPFYGEKGGQAGDMGIIKTASGVFIVEDTQIPVEGLTVHRGRVKDGILTRKQRAESGTDVLYRKNVSKNHTSTHILHWALRTLFGKEVAQAGSSAENDRFRFDYNLNKIPSQEEILKIEKLVNEKIQKNDAVKIFETTREYAAEIGAISLFEEKYGKFVRVVEINDYSRELCGGTHVKRTGEIGLLKIISDTGIGSNIRRIEAVTGLAAYDYLNDAYRLIEELNEILGTDSRNLKIKVEFLKDSCKIITDKYLKTQISLIKKEIIEKNLNNISKGGSIIIEFDFNSSELRNEIDAKNMGLIGDEIINQYSGKKLLLIFSNNINGKPFILFQASKELVKKGFDCSFIAREAGKILKGGGGGKPEFAQVGGSDISAMSNAVQLSVKLAREKISAIDNL